MHRRISALIFVLIFPATVVISSTVSAQVEPVGPQRVLDVGSMDKSVDPCTDFFTYSCGGWIKKNPIPPDQTSWSVYSKLDDDNKSILREILESSALPAGRRDALTQKIGDYYAACMDEKAVNDAAIKPLQPLLNEIEQMHSKRDIASVAAAMVSTDALFRFRSDQDFKDATQVIAEADQGGLGLPDRDYYLKTDAKSAEIRDKYVAHVQRMLELAGEPADRAKADAQTVMKIETDLAKGSLDRVSRRDPEKVYHRMSRQELAALNPAFRWNQYFTDSGAPQFQDINVASPDFFKALNGALESATLDDWKTYLRWHLLHSEAVLLPTPFVDENFNFYGKTLTGAKEQRPRWKRCVDFTDNQLGEALGRKFVERTFGAEGKERTLKMVGALEKALGQDIEKLSWMTPATKQQAEIKLKAITNKIGYPDKWRDYSSVEIKRDDPVDR